VRREVREETGLEIEPLSVFEIFERIIRDEAGVAEYHYVLIDYLCRVTGGTLRAGDDAGLNVQRETHQDTVIGQDARIGPGSTLRNCILWDKVSVGKRVRLENCVIGHAARVTESISMYEGSVIQAT